METLSNLANFQLEEIQSSIRAYSYDIDSIKHINRNINNDIIRCNDFKEIVWSKEPRNQERRWINSSFSPLAILVWISEFQQYNSFP